MTENKARLESVSLADNHDCSRTHGQTVYKSNRPEIKARLQCITKSGGACTKTLSLVDGKLVKDASDCWISTGTVETVELNLSDLPEWLTGLSQSQALVLSNVNLGKQSIVRMQDSATHPDALTRTRSVMPWQEGPAIFLIDIDPSDQYQPESLEQAFDDVESVIPGFKDAAKVVVHSTSSHISTGEGERLTSDGGYHIYVMVSDAARLPTLPEIRRRVEARFFLDGGHGYILISKSGTKLLRGPVDSSVFAPERLSFEADAVLGKGLVQRRPDPEYLPGGLLDPVTAFPPLSASEQMRAHVRRQELLAEAEPAADKVRKDWLRMRSQVVRRELKEAGVTMSPVVIRERLSAMHDRQRTVVGELILTFAGSGKVRVADVLRDPAKYDGEYLADPMEPDYSTPGRVNTSKAIFNARLDAPSAGPCIWSFAHAGVHYDLRHSRESLAETLRDLGGGDAPQSEIFHHAALTRMASATERQAVVLCVKSETSIGIKPIKTDLAEAESRRDAELMLYRKEYDDRGSRKEQPSPEALAALDQETKQLQRDEQYADCREIAEAPNILRLVWDALHATGVVGEDNIIGMVFLGLASSQLNKPLAIKIHGDSSSGKSYVTDKVVQLVPDAFVYEMTAGSARFMVYETEEFSHRIIYVREATMLQASDADDTNIFAALLREMISNGRIIYQVVVRDGDQHITRRIERPGPVGVLITTTATTLHTENETRMINAHTNSTHEHTQAIHLATASVADGSLPELDTAPWHAFMWWLALGPRKVTIPFAKVLAKTFPNRPVRTRRDLRSLFSLIEASALIHQASRAAEGGEIVAELDDYEFTAPLIEAMIAVETKFKVNPHVRKLVEHVEWQAAIKLAKLLAKLTEPLHALASVSPPEELADEVQAAVNAHKAWSTNKSSAAEAALSEAVQALAEQLPFKNLTEVDVPITADELQTLIERDDSAVKRTCTEAYRAGYLENVSRTVTSTRQFKLKQEMPRKDRVILPTRKQLEYEIEKNISVSTGV